RGGGAGLERAWPVGETGDLTRSQTSRAAEGEGVEPSRACGLVPVRAGCHRRLACPSVFLAPSSTAADDACDKLFSFGRTSGGHKPDAQAKEELLLRLRVRLVSPRMIPVDPGGDVLTRTATSRPPPPAPARPPRP